MQLEGAGIEPDGPLDVGEASLAHRLEGDSHLAPRGARHSEAVIPHEVVGEEDLRIGGEVLDRSVLEGARISHQCERFGGEAYEGVLGNAASDLVRFTAHRE